MKIMDFMVRSAVILHLESETKEAVLDELSRALAKAVPVFDEKRLFDVLKEREDLHSTGIGDGIAIPHGRVTDIDTPVISFARSQKGIDFASADGEPAKLFFLLISPEHTSIQYLRILAQLSRYLHNPHVRQKLVDAKSIEDIFLTIGEEDMKF